MFNAQILHGGASVYSPWFPREADNLNVSADMVKVEGTISLTIQTVHKAADVTGDGSPITTSILTLSSAGYVSDQVEGLNEMVRYKYVVSGSASDYVMFRMLPPSWYNTALPA